MFEIGKMTFEVRAAVSKLQKASAALCGPYSGWKLCSQNVFYARSLELVVCIGRSPFRPSIRFPPLRRSVEHVTKYII